MELSPSGACVADGDAVVAMLGTDGVATEAGNNIIALAK